MRLSRSGPAMNLFVLVVWGLFSLVFWRDILAYVSRFPPFTWLAIGTSKPVQTSQAFHSLTIYSQWVGNNSAQVRCLWCITLIWVALFAHWNLDCLQLRRSKKRSFLSSSGGARNSLILHQHSGRSLAPCIIAGFMLSCDRVCTIIVPIVVL